MKVGPARVLNTVSEIRSAIRLLQRRHICLWPGGPFAGRLPALHSLAYSVIYPSEDDSYPVGGGRWPKRSLTAAFLHKIGSVAGIQWIPDGAVRTFDADAPYMRSYKQAGKVRTPDLAWLVITQTRTIDLSGDREFPSTWSDCTREIMRTAARKGRDGWRQVERQRAYIDEAGETKAKARVIRAALGLKQGYTRGELKRGFVVWRVQFTGRTDDRETARKFEERMLDVAMSARDFLYPGPERSGQEAQKPGRP